MTTPIDAHQVLMTGENSFIRLSHDGGTTMSDRTSHWRVLWCPAGTGHALFMQGELTGGQRVAVTGSIRLDGSVGDVGGVAQKAVTARNAGAQMIIVPEASVDEALSGAGDVPVVGVATLDDALQALVGAGGEPVARLLG